MFVVKEETEREKQTCNSVSLFKNDHGRFVDFESGAGCFDLGNESSDTFVFNPSHDFERNKNATVAVKN